MNCSQNFICGFLINYDDTINFVSSFGLILIIIQEYLKKKIKLQNQ